MDGFTDSLSQRFKTPQDMINANSQADAEEMKNLQEQVEKYEGVLDKINETVDTLDKKIDEIKPAEAPVIDTEEYTTKLSGVEGKLQEHIHKENVRVYRNVQASVVDELSKQTEELSEKINKLDVKLDKIEETLNSLAQGQTSNKEFLTDEAAKAGKGKAVLPLQIIAFIVLLADVAFNVLRYLGII